MNILNKIKSIFTRTKYIYLSPKEYGTRIRPGESLGMSVMVDVDKGYLFIKNNGKHDVYICTDRAK